MKALAALFAVYLCAAVVATAFPQGIAVRIEPEAAAIDTESSQVFSARVDGTGDQRMIWEAEGGKISPAGAGGYTFTAPREPGSYSIRVTSIADPGKYAIARIAVRMPALSIVCDDEANCSIAGLRTGEKYRVTVEAGTRKDSIEEVAP